VEYNIEFAEKPGFLYYEKLLFKKLDLSDSLIIIYKRRQKRRIENVKAI